MKVQLKIMFFYILAAGSLFAQDLDLANTYYQQGEYEKAAELFKKISTNKETARQIHQNYLNTLYKIKDYKTAEKFIKSQIKDNANSIVYKADYTQLLEISGNPSLAQIELEKLIQEAASQEGYLYELQNFLFKTNKFDLAAKLLLAGRAKSKEASKYDTQLARVYLYLGNKDKMLDEVLNYGERSKNASYVQATIQDNFREEDEIEALEKILYQRIQDKPNETFYNDLLIWHFIQKQDYARAFVQAKALDKRLKQEGSKIFEIAGTSFSSGDFKNSAKMYQYIMEQYPTSDLYAFARRWYIQSKEEVIKTTYPVNNEDIKQLIEQYNAMIADLGINPKTIDALRNMALLNAFYLQDQNKAIELLESAIKVAGSNQKFKDQCKLDMGDIFILKNEPWESTLLYMQVEKTQKEDILGEMAKLKNARLQYYTGQFALSKDILDILKKATTREIANDAMQLSLLIQDNTGLDTSETAMAAFSKVDLLIFQNKYEESTIALDSLYKTYKTHSLADEILWLRANTLLKINRQDEAIIDLQKIMLDFKYDILADDALYTLAKITEEKLKDKTTAMELYKQLLKEYPGSVFGAQARVRFRELRGDYVN